MVMQDTHNVVRIEVILCFSKGFVMKTYLVLVNVTHEVIRQVEIYVKTDGNLTAYDVEVALSNNVDIHLNNELCGDLYQSMDDWEWIDGEHTFIRTVTEIDPSDKSISNGVPTLVIKEDGEIVALPS